MIELFTISVDNTILETPPISKKVHNIFDRKVFVNIQKKHWMLPKEWLMECTSKAVEKYGLPAIFHQK